MFLRLSIKAVLLAYSSELLGGILQRKQKGLFSSHICEMQRDSRAVWQMSQKGVLMLLRILIVLCSVVVLISAAGCVGTKGSKVTPPSSLT
jgi:hypothetical protein